MQTQGNSSLSISHSARGRKNRALPHHTRHLRCAGGGGRDGRGGGSLAQEKPVSILGENLGAVVALEFLRSISRIFRRF